MSDNKKELKIKGNKMSKMKDYIRFYVNIQFGLVVLFFIVFLLVWNFNFSSFYKVIALGLLCLFFSLHSVEIVLKSESGVFPNLRNYLLIIIMWLFFLVYLALALKEIAITLTLTHFTLLLSIFWVLVPFVSIFMKSKKIWPRLGSYVIGSGLVILIFGYMLALADGFATNDLGKINTNDTIDAWDFIYFSASIFYSANFGDYYPIGSIMRILSIMAAIASILVHIFFITEVYEQNKERN